METYDKVAIGIALAGLCGLVFVQSRKSAELHRKWDEYDRACGVYQEYLKSMDYACDRKGYISKIKVNTQVEYKNKGQDPEEQRYVYTLNITMNEKFTELSDEEKCLILCRYEEASDSEIARVRQESGYERAFSDLAINDNKYDIRYRNRRIDIHHQSRVEFYSKTETYRVGAYDFEIWSKEKGKRLYHAVYSYDKNTLRVFEPQSETGKSSGSYGSTTSKDSSTETSSAKKSSGSKKRSSKSKKRVYNDDERDIDDVDIEGFYEDNRSEFEDFDDAWDYLEDNPEELDDY